jgi:hypothetical protein
LEQLARLLEPPRNIGSYSSGTKAVLRDVRAALQKVQTVSPEVFENALKDDTVGALDILLDEAADIAVEVENCARSPPPLAGVEWLLSQLGATVFKHTAAAVLSRPSSASSPATAELWQPCERLFAPGAVAWEHLEACLRREVADIATTKSPGGQLFDAIEANDLARLRFFLDVGLSASVCGQGGETALMAAALRNHWKCLALLLEFGANAGTSDETGDTAFHYACSFASFDCIGILARCDDAEHVGKRNRAGMTGRALAESLSLWTVVAEIDRVFSQRTGLSTPVPPGTSLWISAADGTGV